MPLTQSASVHHKSPKGIKFPMFNSCPLTNKLDGLPASGGKDQRGAIKKAILRKHLYRAAINEDIQLQELILNRKWRSKHSRKVRMKIGSSRLRAIDANLAAFPAVDYLH
jgi:hypothetical protein